MQSFEKRRDKMADSLESESAAALLSIKNGQWKIGQLGSLGGADGIGRATLSPTPSTSPRRGNPPRIRKRNRLFYNDDEETSYKPGRSSPRKTPRVVSPQKTSSQSGFDKKVAQKLGMRLRNLLKLPKAHKWVCYEFFYSNLDKMSPAFFDEERRSLNSKRHKIRLLQQRKAADLAHFKDLPVEIPLPLVIGTKVTARLRKPQDGLFTGSIDAVDTSNATYRVTFDRQGLGTHSIPDYEVLSSEPQETMPISSFAEKHRPRTSFFTPPRFILPGSPPPQLDNDPVLGGSPLKSQLLGLEGGTLGGFPIKFLVLVVRLSKILDVKKEKIRQLREMNTQAERMKSYQEPIMVSFQQRYASTVLELDKLNQDLNEYLCGVQQFCQEIAPEQGLQPIVQTNVVREKCDDDSRDIVLAANLALGKKGARNEHMLDLITSLTSLMLQVKCLAENDLNSFELKSLNESLSDIQSKIDPSNLTTFQNNVEVHVNHIQSGMSQMGNLHAFAAQSVL